MRTVLQLESTRNHQWRSLHEILLGRGVISEEVVTALELYCQRWQISQYQAILDCHVLTENELTNHLAEEFEFERLSDFQEAQQAFELQRTLTYPQAKYHCLLFVRRQSSGQILVL